MSYRPFAKLEIVANKERIGSHKSREFNFFANINLTESQVFKATEPKYKSKSNQLKTLHEIGEGALHHARGLARTS